MNSQIIKFNRQKMKVVCRDEADLSVINEIFKFREYRSAEKIITSASDPILDVGAHAGFFSLYARALNPAVKIYALEPEAGNLQAAAGNIKENKVKNFTLIPKALAATSGQRQLILSPDNINHRLALAGEETIGAQTQAVAAISLSDLCRQFKVKKFSLVKIDIEGGEYEIVATLKAVDWKKISVLVLEYHNQGSNGRKVLEDILRMAGFGVQNFPSRFDKQLGFLLATNKRI